MPGTFTQIYIQAIFAVKGRTNLLVKPWREEVFKYMSGIIKNKNQKPIIVNGVSDHVHLLIGLKPVMCLSDLIRDVKNNTTNFINKQKWIKGKFSWQEGYGAFSYSHSQLSNVYIISRLKKNITAKKLLEKNILIFLKNLKSIMTKNIYLIGLNNITPSGFIIKL